MPIRSKREKEEGQERREIPLLGDPLQQEIDGRG